MHIDINNYDYPLPDSRIAKYPLPQRDSANLLISSPETLTTTVFRELPKWLPADNLLVINDTKVIQARLYFQKATGARIEIFLLEPAFPADYEQMFQSTESCTWKCLIGNAKKWKDEVLCINAEVSPADNNTKANAFSFTAQRGEPTDDGHLITFSWDNDNLTFADIIHTLGELPIPPYLNRRTEKEDNITYQTVYSEIKGSVAAPTAGLHFTNDVLENIRQRNIDIAKVTLHVGAGTFRPVKTDDVTQHNMHAEHICITAETIQQLINHDAKATAVGTTSVRTLESLYYIGKKILRNPDISPEQLYVQQWEPYDEDASALKPTPKETLQSLLAYMKQRQLTQLHTTTQIIIVPGYQYHFVKALVTNFHQPRSTLLLLVSAFVGERWRDIYRYALEHDYRFLSYGDATLLFP